MFVELICIFCSTRSINMFQNCSSWNPKRVKHNSKQSSTVSTVSNINQHVSTHVQHASTNFKQVQHLSNSFKTRYKQTSNLFGINWTRFKQLHNIATISCGRRGCRSLGWKNWAYFYIGGEKTKCWTDMVSDVRMLRLYGCDCFNVFLNKSRTNQLRTIAKIENN